MVPEIGRFALILGFMISLAQAILPMAGAYRRDARAMAFGDAAAIAQAAAICIAFLCLIYAFVTSDFSVRIVAENSHTAKPLFYKIAGSWGNHEGSMLLWVMVLAVFGATVALAGRNIPQVMRARVLSIQALIGAGFLAFIIFTSNPFARLDDAPLQGAGLNPLLQDPGLVSHPPMLYLGYVGFSTAFSFAVAALIEGRADSVWARLARPWILAAWVFLTIGICLGSLWAYCELGWGGWWFWDPVENVSLMPWLLGTALLHSALVVERRHSFVRWTLLLSIVTFSMSLVGTFVVRSGVLTSVHAFAVDPERGVFILALLAAAIGGGLTLYALRAPKLESGVAFASVSREGALVFNNALLVALAATVFIGTFYPLFIDLIGRDKISVGAPFYALTFTPLATPLLVILIIGPLLRWRVDRPADAVRRVKWPSIIAAAAVVLSLALTGANNVIASLGMGLAVWVICGSALIWTRRVRWREIPLADSLRMARALPRSLYGVVAAHAGVGVLMAGLVAANAWKAELTLGMAPGDHAQFAGYDVQMLSITDGQGPNYELERALLVFSGNGGGLMLTPERRYFPERESVTSEAALHVGLFDTYYAALGDRSDETGKWALRLYRHPFVIWIWLGAAIMAFGGFLSWSDGRLRALFTAREHATVAAAAE